MILKKELRQRVSRFWLLLLGILVLASVLRLSALDAYPQSFDQDGMLLGYDAWSVWTTGHDHHGAFFPVFFQSYWNPSATNDYDPPVSRYVAAPFVGILGLSEETTRLPFALMGVAAVLLVALLGRRWFNAAAGLVAALLLTIDPWHINNSRIAHPIACLPFFTVLGLYCFTRSTSLFAMQKDRHFLRRARLWLVGSALSFALLTGTYQTMKIQAPLLLCACAVAVLPFVGSTFSRLGWTDFFIWLALYGLFISPLVLEQILYWNRFQPHFAGMSTLSQPNGLALFFTQYLNTYNPSGLFFIGFGDSLQVLPPQGVGELLWLEWPLWVFAVIGMSQHRHLSRQVGLVVPVLLTIWFLTFPIASSLTTPSPIERRIYNFLPLPEILAGYGAVVAWELLKRYRWKWFSAAQVALAISIIMLLIFNWMFLSFFFSPPLLQTDATADQIPYNIGLRPVLTKVMQQVKPCDTVWLEPTNQTYIYYLFFTRYPSNLFLSTGQEVDAFQQVYGSVGQVHFAIPGGAVALPAGCQGKPSRTFFITRTAQVGPGWQQIIAERNHAGVSIWQALMKM
ncbi:MAG TPA: phospholipid carrier-dependent glycosyltransferase [Ktedonobacteraceae bacterium]|jgi:4-amino-4-deoxy-L-arabinose transferase-like glycosyltransferase